MLGLLLEFCHRLRIMPTRAGQIPIVLISIFLKPLPHMAISLMTAKSTISHVTISGCGRYPRGPGHQLVFHAFNRLGILDAPN
jgi:hypothetical protein